MTPQGPGEWFASSEPFQIETGNVSYESVTLDREWTAELTSGTDLQFQAETAGLYAITGNGMTGLYVRNGYGSDVAGQSGENYFYGVYLRANETVYFGVDQNSGTEKECELLVQQVTDTDLKGLGTASLGENTLTRSQPLKFTATSGGTHRFSVNGASFQRLEENRWIDCYSSANLELEAGQSIWVQMFYGDGNSPMTATLMITGPTAPEGSSLELTSATTEGVMLQVGFKLTTGTDALQNGYGVTLLLSDNRDDFSAPLAHRSIMNGKQLKISSEESSTLKMAPNMNVWGRLIMTPQGPGEWFASSEPFQIETGNVSYESVTLDREWTAELTSGTDLQFQAETAGLYAITGNGMTGLYVRNGYGSDVAGQSGENYFYGVYLRANETVYFGVDQNSGTEKECELLVQQVTDTDLKGLGTASLGENTLTRSQPLKFTATSGGTHRFSVNGASFQRLEENRWIDCYSSANLELEAGQSIWVQMFYGDGNSPMTANLTITGPTAPEGSSLELVGTPATEGVMLNLRFSVTTGTDAIENGYGVTLLLSNNRDDFSSPVARRNLMGGNQLKISSEESSTLKMAPNMNVWGRLIMTPQGPGEWFASSEPFQIETGNVSYESVTLDREWTAELTSGTDLQFQAETAGLYAITGNGMTGLYVRNGYGSDVAGQSGENYFYGVYLRANETVYFGVDQNSGTEKECELLVQQVTDTDLKGLGTASLGENTLTRSQPLKFTATSGGTHRFSVNGASFQRLEENRWIDCYSSANLELEAGQSIWVQMFYGDGNSPMTATLTITLS